MATLTFGLERWSGRFMSASSWWGQLHVCILWYILNSCSIDVLSSAIFDIPVDVWILGREAGSTRCPVENLVDNSITALKEAFGMDWWTMYPLYRDSWINGFNWHTNTSKGFSPRGDAFQSVLSQVIYPDTNMNIGSLMLGHRCWIMDVGLGMLCWGCWVVNVVCNDQVVWTYSVLMIIKSTLLELQVPTI